MHSVTSSLGVTVLLPDVAKKCATPLRGRFAYADFATKTHASLAVFHQSGTSVQQQQQQYSQNLI